MWQGKIDGEIEKRAKFEKTIKIRKPLVHKEFADFLGPSDRSRTCGLLNPIQALYQTGLHPDNAVIIPHLLEKCKSFFIYF